ncbi:glycerol-3-phosphate dehydrogenase 1-like protein isoform X2 [Hippocampus comes]|uniref:glycerol-3-phosphate dehydrogenase 1-like protein isoform X2 n=1 Tax=Hippocampus comes TaxID=109280 RepID=UPI00094F11D6|nr:PREDICTED: glycerol-3-phosphate dehydrogenase 1-like protein isoform X2 [Hippocampus comes]
MASPLKVCIVGSGNWGSAIARIIGNNARSLQHFATTVKMWVFEENINGRKLTDIINTEHENVKYLPGYKLPDNVVAVPSLRDAAEGADLLVFVVPHQFIRKLCDELVGCVPTKARGITLIKGIDEGPEGLKLISDIIREKMGIDVSVLMGANIANEVAAEKFCETTIGSKILENGLLFKELLQTPNFRITVVDDADTVELCGALKRSHELTNDFVWKMRNVKAALALPTLLSIHYLQLEPIQSDTGQRIASPLHLKKEFIYTCQIAGRKVYKASYVLFISNQPIPHLG